MSYSRDKLNPVNLPYGFHTPSSSQTRPISIMSNPGEFTHIPHPLSYVPASNSIESYQDGKIENEREVSAAPERSRAFSFSHASSDDDQTDITYKSYISTKYDAGKTTGDSEYYDHRKKSIQEENEERIQNLLGSHGDKSSTRQTLGHLPHDKPREYDSHPDIPDKVKESPPKSISSSSSPHGPPTDYDNITKESIPFPPVPEIPLTTDESIEDWGELSQPIKLFSSTKSTTSPKKYSQTSSSSTPHSPSYFHQPLSTSSYLPSSSSFLSTSLHQSPKFSTSLSSSSSSGYGSTSSSSVMSSSTTNSTVGPSTSAYGFGSYTPSSPFSHSTVMAEQSLLMQINGLRKENALLRHSHFTERDELIKRNKQLNSELFKLKSSGSRVEKQLSSRVKDLESQLQHVNHLQQRELSKIRKDHEALLERKEKTLSSERREREEMEARQRMSKGKCHSLLKQRASQCTIMRNLSNSCSECTALVSSLFTRLYSSAETLAHQLGELFSSGIGLALSSELSKWEKICSIVRDIEVKLRTSCDTTESKELLSAAKTSDSHQIDAGDKGSKYTAKSTSHLGQIRQNSLDIPSHISLDPSPAFEDSESTFQDDSTHEFHQHHLSSNTLRLIESLSLQLSSLCRDTSASSVMTSNNTLGFMLETCGCVSTRNVGMTAHKVTSVTLQKGKETDGSGSAHSSPTSQSNPRTPRASHSTIRPSNPFIDAAHTPMPKSLPHSDSSSASKRTRIPSVRDGRSQPHIQDIVGGHESASDVMHSTPSKSNIIRRQEFLTMSRSNSDLKRQLQQEKERVQALTEELRKKDKKARAELRRRIEEEVDSEHTLVHPALTRNMSGSLKHLNRQASSSPSISGPSTLSVHRDHLPSTSSSHPVPKIATNPADQSPVIQSDIHAPLLHEDENAVREDEQFGGIEHSDLLKGRWESKWEEIDDDKYTSGDQSAEAVSESSSSSSEADERAIITINALSRKQIHRNSLPIGSRPYLLKDSNTNVPEDTSITHDLSSQSIHTESIHTESIHTESPLPPKHPHSSHTSSSSSSSHPIPKIAPKHPHRGSSGDEEDGMTVVTLSDDESTVTQSGIQSTEEVSNKISHFAQADDRLDVVDEECRKMGDQRLHQSEPVDLSKETKRKEREIKLQEREREKKAKEEVLRSQIQHQKETMSDLQLYIDNISQNLEGF
ncbi:hypothetical protein ADUPG1_009486 [Aduncisulcus paluster]|uniref:Uncharacterized protein n=1 Tax=Aduncisulcus paluster TaxID=2918883 RepID=A0ABQ5KVT8_9EUKA|nr:hypothetical protein ADUPG1_009486 [Aduncisulcus paluster]